MAVGSSKKFLSLYDKCLFPGYDLSCSQSIFLLTSFVCMLYLYRSHAHEKTDKLGLVEITCNKILFIAFCDRDDRETARKSEKVITCFIL